MRIDTRALRWAGDILTDIRSGKITDLEEIKRQAKVILRHYPSAHEIASEAKSISQASMFRWLGPEEE